MPEAPQHDETWISVRISTDERDWLKTTAEREHRTLAGQVRLLVALAREAEQKEAAA